MRWGVLAKKIHEMLERRRLVFVFAPTGYGKTMASPILLDLARKSGLASRLIHVVPTRALLREIYREKFANTGFHVGYQSMDRLPDGNKSPYFLSDITVTTVDSFLWNVYKIPVAEISKVIDGRSEGHYYPALAAIATSIVVFDEAHIYIGEPGEERADVVTPAVEALYRLGVSTVIATATMSAKFVERLLSKVGIDRDAVSAVYACGARCNKHVESLEKIIHVEYVDGLGVEIKWETRLIEEKGVKDEIERLCKDGVVLAVANTVERAVEWYRGASCDDKTLIHSRLTEGDREKVEGKMKEIKGNRRGLIVASPIVEVGVEIDADVLITDAAPLDNLIQRAGRLCRSARACEGRVYVVKDSPSIPYDVNEVKTAVERLELTSGKCVEWRRFDSKRCVPIIDVLNDVQSARIFSSELLSKYLIKDRPPSALIKDVEIEKLFRSLSLIGVIIGEKASIDAIGRETFVTSVNTLKWLEGKKKQCLSIESERVKAWLLVTRKHERLLKPISSEVLYKVIYGDASRWIRGLNREIADSLEVGEGALQLFVELKNECYKPGEGAYV
ncbi:MAG: CRISPR-associated helicase Cas3' [Pyrobaculum sp.]